ncbi:carboxylesterase family protein [Dysgonomonas macrotermitis]|uniref:Predicted peptidase n=1 Tax=Dysgonomonas macrotermitis TaxID=1346286 RepID=A0A1M4SEG0_9BACT|nr:alpha/beta hydrolase-fold protein [Dysgonomonas macrotermitis]SHE30571.1 Predicted peptidase [Dysgonomonas macrotermitis]
MNNKRRYSFVIVAVLLTLNLLSACKNNSNGKPSDDNQISDSTQTKRGSATPDKSNDAELKALLAETVDKFTQREYKDPQTGKTMSYNLFIPEGYDKNKQYPLVLFIADASTAGKDTKYPLIQGYGAGVWATAKEQAKHPSFILVPQYTVKAVNDDFETSDEVEMTIRLLEQVTGQYSIDKNRLYTTGQSMGGMMSMYFNIAHPGLFAASIYVGCQWDTSKMAGFAKDKFFYIVAAGDEKTPKGMAALKTVLENKGAKISSAEWSAKLPREEQESKVQELLAKGNSINFVTFTLGSVQPEDGSGNEHMNSFDYAYKLEGVRDWLFKQTKNK